MPTTASEVPTMSSQSSQAVSRADQVTDLLVGAIDLHCHSGPAVMPRILDHHDALMDAAAARFKAVIYKDHYYPGMAHAAILEKLFLKDTGVRLFSGLVLNNAMGGWNPHAVDHAIKLGARIVWLPTVSAANHIAHVETGKTKTFPKTAQKMLDAIPLSAMDDNGQLLDPVKKILDLIAAGDIILAGGHLPVAELHVVFAEARARGVTKMLVNHPTYMVGAGDADIRDLAAAGVSMEHSICMFVDGRSKRFSAADLKHLIDTAGGDKTILSSDLGLTGCVRPVEGFRAIVEMLLDLQVTETDIRRLISSNAAALLGLEP
jgi:uncharacterized protein DUF6282